MCCMAQVGDQLLYLKAPGDPLPQDITGEEDAHTLAALGVQVR